MNGKLRTLAITVSHAALLWPAVLDNSKAPRPKLTCAEMEQFLLEATIGRQRDISKGGTLPKCATLAFGELRHDAGIQTIDISKSRFQTHRGTELNFRDSWKFNVAGYGLAKLLGLNMVPPYVARTVGRKPASLSWWIDGALDELDRIRGKMDPPDLENWEREMYVIRVFHQLIYDTDANLTNVLIAKDGRLWMIDFTRAFRTQESLLNPNSLARCDRKLLNRLRELNKPLLQQRLNSYLNDIEIDSLLARRNKIVRFFDEQIAAKGEAGVLFDLPRSGEACGVGL